MRDPTVLLVRQRGHNPPNWEISFPPGGKKIAQFAPAVVHGGVRAAALGFRPRAFEARYVASDTYCMEPVRPIHRRDNAMGLVVTRVAEAHVRRETPEEASERRRQEERERARKRAARAWADDQLRRLEAQQAQGLVSEDESDDGRPHVDIRI